MGVDFVGPVVIRDTSPNRLKTQMSFLANLVKVFPSLKTRPLHLTGESYAGTYIVRHLSHRQALETLSMGHSHTSRKRILA